MIAGTFDIIHPGHLYFINQAAKLGEVFVVVATDRNAKRFKGKAPVVPENQRVEVIQSIKNVHKAILGNKKNDTIKTVEDIDPDIILLGPDQKYSSQKLKSSLEEKGLGHIEVKRLKTYYDKYKLHSSSLIKKKIINRYKKETESEPSANPS
jgi:FAD synthetase